MPIVRESRSQIVAAACAIEPSYGGAVTIAKNTQGFLMVDSPVTVAPQIESQNFRTHSFAFTRRKNTIGIRLMQRELSFFLQGGALGVADRVGPLLRCCALNETVVPTTGPVTYRPAAISELVSAKLEAWEDGPLWVTSGLYGNFVLSCAAGGPPRVRFTGVGKFALPTLSDDYPTVPGPGWTGQTPRYLPFLNAALTVNNGASWSPAVQSIEFNRGVVTSRIPDANDATGLAKTFVSDAVPTFTLVVALETDDGATITYDDLFNDWLSSTTHALTCTLDAGAGAGGIGTLTLAQAQVQQVTEGEGDAFRTATVLYHVQHQTDNQEFALAWT